LCRHFENNFEAMRSANKEELMTIDGIGDVLADAWIDFFQNDENNKMVNRLMDELTIEEPVIKEESTLFDGMNFVITGAVEHFKNRKEIQALIESKGGRVTDSVTSKTTYLINNDTLSNSSKNKKAKELGIPILSEEDFVKICDTAE
ncbi:MAG: BRCT domain-containing protein, partial [Clostridium sp.]